MLERESSRYRMRFTRLSKINSMCLNISLDVYSHKYPWVAKFFTYGNWIEVVLPDINEFFR